MTSPDTATIAKELQGGRKRADSVFRAATFAAAALVLVVLLLILWTVTKKSTDVFDVMGVRFFTEKRWAPNDEVYGALAFIFGTIVTALIAVVLAVPLSIGIALFTTQIAPPRLRGALVTLTDLVSVVPSVVFGLWGVIYLAPKLVGFYENMHNWFGDVPVAGALFGPANAGRTFATAGIILTIMITPIITSISREVMDTCPREERDGALALGATQTEMIRGAVLPHSFGGIVGAVMLGLGRAMGETIAAALVIGSSATITANLFSSGDSLPAVIAFQWGEATTETKRSALIAMGLVLFLMTVVVNAAANLIVGRYTRRIRGAE